LTPAFNKRREQIGYRMFPVDGPKGLDRFMEAGLQPGDLLTAIDGSNVVDPTAADMLLRTLGSGAQANVTITRAGKQLQLALKGQ
jgi:type II secretory pathway component PulC